MRSTNLYFCANFGFHPQYVKNVFGFDSIDSINLDIYIFAKTFNFGTKIQTDFLIRIFGHTVIVPSKNTQLFDKVDKPINQ